MIISISGPPGSGCSTTCRSISLNLSMSYYSTGKHFKELAKEQKISEDALRDIAMTDPTSDYEVDRTLAHACEKDMLVLDSKLAAWKLDKVDLRVYLHAPLRVRANRLSKKLKVPVSEAINLIEVKENKDTKRFLNWYGINIEDVSVYDLIINTEKWDVDGILFVISKALQRMRR